MMIGSSKFFLNALNELYSLLNIVSTVYCSPIFFGYDKKKLIISATDE